MSERDKLIILLNACFILLFSFLIMALCHNEKQIRQLDEKQAEINRAAYEKTERMAKEIRLLSQDVRIHNNILLTQEYILEDEE
jgi:hypothetical protein